MAALENTGNAMKPPTKADRIGDVDADAVQQQLRIGIRGSLITLNVFGRVLGIDADTADQIAADLRNFALELRNGGRLS